jgi:hypothetical protein
MFTNFSMFTEKGNQKVADIVTRAKHYGWDWARTQSELYVLADSDAQLYGEATDTAVREVVYQAIGADQRNENFYC